MLFRVSGLLRNLCCLEVFLLMVSGTPLTTSWLHFLSSQVRHNEIHRDEMVHRDDLRKMEAYKYRDGYHK